MNPALPQTSPKPPHSHSLFDRSKFSEANGVTSLQVSGDFTSLSSLLNLLRKSWIQKPVFGVSLFPWHGWCLVAAPWGWGSQEWGSSSQERVKHGQGFGLLCWGRHCSFVCLEVLAGKRGGENYLSDSEVAMNYIKL